MSSSGTMVVRPSEQRSSISPPAILRTCMSTLSSSLPPRARVTTLRRGWLRAWSAESTPFWICSFTQEWSLVSWLNSPLLQR